MKKKLRIVNRYLDEAEAGLEHRYSHKGNTYAALTKSTHLTEVERMKLVICTTVDYNLMTKKDIT